ncbi:MAG TPA: hypothetical protein VI776_12555 [Anaerolineales bacterium]|nr:hypothetical protein [Anaerolineales bacterium]
MPIYLSILFLILTPVIMLIVRLVRPGFVYHWLLAVGGAGIAWLMVLLAGLQFPRTLELVAWKPEILFTSSPFLIVDRFSWPFAAGIATLLLAVILTDVARPAEVDWSSWAGELSLAGLGLFAILAGNPLTLVLAWTAIDLLELTILLGEVKEAGATREVVIRFSIRLVGSFLLIAAGLSSEDTGAGLSFSVTSPRAILLFLAAGGLRLGVFPLHFPFRQRQGIRLGLDILTLLIPAASTLVLLTRSASAMEISGLTAQFSSLLMFMVGCAAVLAATAWCVGVDAFEGRQVWVLATASLALAATLRAQPEASLAWGLAVIFAGGLLLLATVRNRWISWFMMVGVAGFSALPLTPTWGGADLFTAPFSPLLLLYWIAHILLLMGYARHALRLSGSFAGLERWVILIYPLGLGLLALVYFLVGWRIRPQTGGLPLALWLEGLLALIVAGLALYWTRRHDRLLHKARAIVEPIFSLDWLYLLVGFFYQLLDRIVGFITLILEGEGGILWVLLWTVLVLLLLARS